MKKSLFLTLAFCGILLASCNNKKGFTKVYGDDKSSDYYYQFFERAEVTEGDLSVQVAENIEKLAEVYWSCTVADTMTIIPARKDYLPILEETFFPGDILTCIKMMNVGDSAAFIVDTRLTFEKFFRSQGLPENIKDTDETRFNIRILNIYSIDELQRIEIEKLKETYPEETATAKAQMDEYTAGNDNITWFESGLGIEFLSEGDGVTPQEGDIVSVHYEGFLIGAEDSTFDSSYERDEPIEFPIGMGYVIKGWDEGIAKLSVGQKARLYIPYYLGYMDRPAGEIPAFSNLIFNVELLDIKANPEKAPMMPEE